MMTMTFAEAWKTALMGLVQGVTEYLPVSSTGHLILCKARLGLELDESFEIFIQFGSVLAVLTALWPRFLRLLRFRENKGFSGLRGWWLLVLSTIPACVAGLVAHDWITENLYGAKPVAWALLAGGVAMIAVEWWMGRKGEGTEVASVDGVGAGQALGVGLFQILALFPGVSRSASTIIGGRVLGLGREAATAYSFFAAVPVLTLASGYSLLKAVSAGEVGAAQLPAYALGTVVSYLASLVAIRFLLKFVARHTFIGFGVYRILLAAAVLLLAA